MELNDITGEIIGAAIEVHHVLGPGLLESTYVAGRIEPIHEAQLLSYLKISRCRIGLLFNFNVKQLAKGLRRLVNELPEQKTYKRLCALCDLCGESITVLSPPPEFEWPGRRRAPHLGMVLYSPQRSQRTRRWN